MTLFEQYPCGFYFEADTGEIVNWFAVNEGRDGERYWRRPTGEYRRVLRAEPWELLTAELLGLDMGDA